MRTLFPQLLLVSLCGCAASTPAPKTADAHPAPTTSASKETTVLGAMLPQPKQAFTLHATPERAPTLQDAVVELEKSTGVHFVVSDAARQVLRSSSSGLLSDLEVPPREAWRVVETMLAQSELLLVPSRGVQPVTISLTTKTERGGQELKGYAVPIDASAIEECVDHPAIVFSTVLDVTPMDARQLAVSMRQLFPDQRTQSIVTVDGSRVMLTGPGPQLLTAVRTMQGAASARGDEKVGAQKSAAPASSATVR